MKLDMLILHNFRNYSSFTCSFDPTITYIVGANAQGKTNILEALYMICTGKGIKDEKQEEMIKFGKNSADIQARALSEDETMLLRITLEKSAYLKKTFQVNKSRKLLYTYLRSTPPAVLFTPELISVIDGSPSLRRSFFDSILCQLDISYQKALRNYENGIRKRNKIFESIHDQEKLKESLHFWNTYLIDNARYIQEKRQWLTEKYNEEKQLQEHSFSLVYISNPITEARLEEYFMKEYYQKRTLIGPQRDEYIVHLESHSMDIDTKKFASRGEQRLALLWLILSQLRLMKDCLNQAPILLLDDIFSELDEHNRAVIVSIIDNYQTIITSTDKSEAQRISPKAQIIEI